MWVSFLWRKVSSDCSGPGKTKVSKMVWNHWCWEPLHWIACYPANLCNFACFMWAYGHLFACTTVWNYHFWIKFVWVLSQFHMCTNLESVYWFQIVIFPSQVVFPHLYTKDSLPCWIWSVWTLFIMNSVLPAVLCHGVISLLWAGYIKAGESIGRSDLTELHREKNSVQPTEEKSISMKKPSW